MTTWVHSVLFYIILPYILLISPFVLQNSKGITLMANIYKVSISSKLIARNIMLFIFHYTLQLYLVIVLKN
jgi:hypothetical protein